MILTVNFHKYAILRTLVTLLSLPGINQDAGSNKLVYYPCLPRPPPILRLALGLLIIGDHNDITCSGLEPF